MNDMPRDFGWRYVAWLAWSNAISVLGTIQAVLAVIVLDPDIALDHVLFHRISLANAIAVVLVAQLKKNNPPGPPPTKSAATAPSVREFPDANNIDSPQDDPPAN